MKRTLLLLLLLLTTVFTVSAQDAPTQINVALADLSQRLGQGVTLQSLDNWTYSQNIYNNTGLGCPLATNATPVTQNISGYTFNLTYRGVAYEYRVSADNTIVVPCSQNLLNVPLAPTLPPELVPLPCPADFAGYLAPRLAIGTRAQVEAGNDPNRLRNAPSVQGEQIGTINPGRTIEVLNGPACADTFVWWQVAVDGQVGWTAEGVLPDDYFLEPLGGAATSAATATPIPPTVVPLSSGNPTALPPVQAGDLPEFAGATGDQAKNVTLFQYGESAITAIGDVATAENEFSYGVGDLVWSADGQRLAYLLGATDNSFNLWVTDSTGSAPVQVASGVFSLLPISFTPEGEQVVYARISNRPPPANSPDGYFEVVTQGFNPGDQPTVIGEILFGSGCGGGGPYPAPFVYMYDTDYNGNPTLLEITPFGLLYTGNCTGDRTMLLDLETGESVEVGTNLGRVALSPDQTQVVGVSLDPQRTSLFAEGVLTIVDLETLQQTPLGAIAQPDQLAWGPNGEIYYSTVTETDQLVPGSDTSTALNQMGLEGGIPVNTYAIHVIDVAAATDTELVSGEAYAVGRLIVSPNGDELFFTTIPMGEEWIAEMEAGGNPAGNAFPVSLYRVPSSGGEPQLLFTGVNRATLNPAAFTSEPAQG